MEAAVVRPESASLTLGGREAVRGLLETGGRDSPARPSSAFLAGG